MCESYLFLELFVLIRIVYFFVCLNKSRRLIIWYCIGGFFVLERRYCIVLDERNVWLFGWDIVFVFVSGCEEWDLKVFVVGNLFVWYVVFKSCIK